MGFDALLDEEPSMKGGWCCGAEDGGLCTLAPPPDRLDVKV
jgi:hypothetical protein